MIHTNREHYAKLQSDIQDTRPDFRPWLEKDKYKDPTSELEAGKESTAMDVSDVKEVIKQCVYPLTPSPCLELNPTTE